MSMENEINDPRISEHMANERTFLAWVRTNIGIMAFGFVIEKFGLFIKQMGLILGKVRIQNPSSSHEYSAIIGILIVGFGILMNLFAYRNFKRTEKQIEQRTTTYRPSEATYSFLIIAIIAVGIFLLMYLVQNSF
jgi:uncharacterized membrane protein YidH (DUF202 family)